MKIERHALVRKPNLVNKLVGRIRYRTNYNNRKYLPNISSEQTDIVHQLNQAGYVTLPEYHAVEKISILQDDFQYALEGLKFDTPCLAQNRIDKVKHADFIANHMLGTPKEIAKLGVAFDQEECYSYRQTIEEFSPSTLTVPMLEYSEAFRSAWLDPFLLNIICHYMGLVPHLAEAYVRRNFFAPYRSMNHFWHRDINQPFHLLKMFVFISDCTIDNGPHEYIRGSYSDPGELKKLNGQRYYSDEEVDRIYPPGSEDRVLSIVKAGTVVLENTFGLHRANIPKQGYRDLGFAVFTPLLPSLSNGYYIFPLGAYEQLSPFAKAFIPKVCVS